MPTDGFPDTMRALRHYRRLTLRQLADRLTARGELGLRTSTLRAIEAAARPSSPHERKAILAALDMPERLSALDLEDALWDWDQLADLADRQTAPAPQPHLQDLAEELARLQQRVLSLTRAQPGREPARQGSQHDSRQIRRQR